METAGVLVLSCGVWVLYCGITGIPVLATASAIISDPANAVTVIATAQAASKEENSVLNVSASSTSSTSGAGATTAPQGTHNPFAGRTISDGFGARGGEHKGIDYPMPAGTPLPAAVAGVVSTTTSGGTGGYIATITTSNGYRVRYMHCSRFVPGIDGAHVVPGQIIAYSGGVAGAPGAGDSTGAHVHFEVDQPDGTAVNPQTYFGS